MPEAHAARPDAAGLDEDQQRARRLAIRDLMPTTPYLAGLGVLFDRYEPDDVVPWCAGLTVERADHVVRVVGSDADRRQAVDTLVLARKPA